MIRITSDTSTMYSRAEAKEAGFAVAPLSVTIAGNTYREYDDMQPAEFIEIIQQGHMPTSSQPAIGDVVDLFNSFSPEDDILNISMADGLSGTYQAAESARLLADHPERITVINSRTLCGPHRYIVENALEMVKKGMSLPAIVRHTEEMMKTAKSYLVPQDFGYLRRGGRLSPLVSYVGHAVRLVPVMQTTEDGRQLSLLGVKRNFAGALESISKNIEACRMDVKHRIYIAHAENPTLAKQAEKMLTERFPQNVIKVVNLSPAFITQGGPGCVAIQTVHI